MMYGPWDRSLLSEAERAEIERIASQKPQYIDVETKTLHRLLVYCLVGLLVVTAAVVGILLLAGVRPLTALAYAFLPLFVGGLLVNALYRSRRDGVEWRAWRECDRQEDAYLATIDYASRLQRRRESQDGGRPESPHWYVDGWQTGYHRRGDFSRADRRAMNEGGMDVDTYRNNVQERDN